MEAGEGQQLRSLEDRPPLEAKQDYPAEIRLLEGKVRGRRRKTQEAEAVRRLRAG
jgi:hypothetical protein